MIFYSNCFTRDLRIFYFSRKLNSAVLIEVIPQKEVSISTCLSKALGFLFFGFIQDYKRLDLFINAAKQIDNARFIIAGACKEWEKYKKIIGQMDNLQCDIHFLNNDEIRSYFQEADYLVLPYDESTQSGPLLIAYNYNIPVIASDIELFKTMVCDEQNGFLFEKGNLGSLIKILDKANNLSESQYQLLVKNMSERKEQYQLTTNFKLALDTFLGKR